MSQPSARAAVARENARQSDGKFGSYHLPDAGTDADLSMGGGPKIMASPSDYWSGERVLGREGIVEHVHSGGLREGEVATATINHGDGIDHYFTGTVHVDRNRKGEVTRAEIRTDHGPQGIYDTGFNNLTPHGLTELTYREEQAPLTKEQQDYARSALGPYADEEAMRKLVAAVDTEVEGPGTERIYDEHVFAQEQRDLLEAAKLLDERAEYRMSVLRSDITFADPDPMPDPATDEMYLNAEGLRDTADETDDPWNVEDQEARRGSVEYARAVLATPKHGIVNPGFEYVTDARSDNTIETDGVLNRTIGEQVAKNDPAYLARFTPPLAIRLSGDRAPKGTIIEMGEEVGRYPTPEKVQEKVEAEIDRAVQVGWLPKNLTYRVESSGKLDQDAQVSITVEGLDDQHRYNDAPDFRGNKEETEGVKELKDRLERLRSNYGQTVYDAKTGDVRRQTYGGGVDLI